MSSEGHTLSEPDQYEQALEAARDDPSRAELTNMVYDLDAVHFSHPDGEDDDCRPTTIDVHLEDDHGRKSDTVMDIMRAAGWKPTYVAFSRNRITFEEAGSR